MESTKKFFILAVVAGLSLSACSSSEKPKKVKPTTSTTETAKQEKKKEKPVSAKGNTAVIRVKKYGTITVKLDPNEAPITVKNFKKLAKQKFYDGLTFHRIIKGFMIQGGDPKGDGTGGAKKNIKGEFKANGVDNTISHKRGVISMARSQDYNSASSQFFIMQKDTPSLDGQYAAFGKVTKGIKVVDKIADKVKPTDDNGTVPKKKQPVIESIRIK